MGVGWGGGRVGGKVGGSGGVGVGSLESGAKGP